MTDRDVGRLDEIKQRVSAITEGDWWRDEDGDILATNATGDTWICAAAARADNEFIAHSPADISWLLAENERLQAACERSVHLLRHIPWTARENWKRAGHTADAAALDQFDHDVAECAKAAGVSSEVDTK